MHSPGFAVRLGPRSKQSNVTNSQSEEDQTSAKPKLPAVSARHEANNALAVSGSFSSALATWTARATMSPTHGLTATDRAQSLEARDRPEPCIEACRADESPGAPAGDSDVRVLRSRCPSYRTQHRALNKTASSQTDVIRAFE